MCCELPGFGTVQFQGYLVHRPLQMVGVFKSAHESGLRWSTIGKHKLKLALEFVDKGSDALGENFPALLRAMKTQDPPRLTPHDRFRLVSWS